MGKLFDHWKAIFGASAVAAAFAFFKKAIPLWQCTADKCIDSADRWPAMLAALFAVVLALLALWSRGNAAERKTKVAVAQAKAAQEDALVIVDAFNIRVIGGKTEFGQGRSIQYSDDIAVGEAVRRVRRSR